MPNFIFKYLWYMGKHTTQFLKPFVCLLFCTLLLLAFCTTSCSEEKRQPYGHFHLSIDGGTERLFDIDSAADWPSNGIYLEFEGDSVNVLAFCYNQRAYYKWQDDSTFTIYYDSADNWVFKQRAYCSVREHQEMWHDNHSEVVLDLPEVAYAQQLADNAAFVFYGYPWDERFGMEPVIQLNHQFANFEDLKPYVEAEISRSQSNNAVPYPTLTFCVSSWVRFKAIGALIDSCERHQFEAIDLAVWGPDSIGLQVFPLVIDSRRSLDEKYRSITAHCYLSGDYRINNKADIRNLEIEVKALLLGNLANDSAAIVKDQAFYANKLVLQVGLNDQLRTSLAEIKQNKENLELVKQFGSVVGMAKPSLVYISSEDDVPYAELIEVMNKISTVQHQLCEALAVKKFNRTYAQCTADEQMYIELHYPLEFAYRSPESSSVNGMGDAIDSPKSPHDDWTP